MRRGSSLRSMQRLRLTIKRLWLSTRRLRLRAAGSTLAALLYSAIATAATNVTALNYDAAEDQLVLTIAYRGTNPDHRFSVQWESCRRLDDERSQILGVLVDNQAADLARQDFTKQLEIDLSDFTCRPARVSIRTSAGFFTSVDIPSPPKKETRPSSDARNAVAP